jgi:hypothetical protein
METEPWDITAKAEGFAGEIPKEQLDLMLRAMIRERFRPPNRSSPPSEAEQST